MPEHARAAARQRDDRLALIGRITTGIAGSAMAAALTFAAAFAHAIPGHAGPPPTSPAGVSGPGPSSTGSAPAGGTSSAPAGGTDQHPGRLAPPQQHPAATQAPSQATSGGS